MRFLLALGLALCLNGCAAVRNYDTELYKTLSQASSGNVDGAIRMLEANNRLPDKDLLYYFELGMLQRLASRYDDSQKSWMAASARLQLTDQALVEASDAVRNASSFLVNDKLRRYQGHDYERVMLLTHIALNHLALGDYEAARVAIKQTHELEAVLEEQRSKERLRVEEEAQKHGAKTSFKELNGYPVETIDTPEVNALRNSYQSALSHYLAGFIYEALGEPSLAAPGYRLANELQPNQPVLEEALRGLDERVGKPDDGLTDVLFVIGSGSAPALRSQQFRLPVPVQEKLLLVTMSFPVMATASLPQRPIALDVDNSLSVAIAPATSIDLMARRRLQDDMPGIMLRASVRSAASATLQYQAQRAGSRDNQNAAAFGALAAIAAVGSVALESADDRTWRTLPSEIHIARARLSAGAHDVVLRTSGGTRTARIQVSGRHAVVDFRLLSYQLFVQSPLQREATGKGSQQ